MIAGVPHARDVPRLSRISLEGLIAQIDMIGHAVDHIDIRVASKKATTCAIALGIIDVIGIQPADDLAIGGADPLVDGVGLAFVCFRYPSHAAAEALEHIDGVVGAAAVEHDMFDLGAGLRRDALKGTFE